MIRTEGTPLRHLWALGYRAAARAGAAVLAGGGGRSVYLAGSLAGGQARWGISDIDLVVVGSEVAVGRARRRWSRVLRWLGPVQGLIADVWGYDDAELRFCAGRTHRDAGLQPSPSGRRREPDRAAYFGHRPVRDEMGLLERPGVDGPAGWRRLAGPERRPSGGCAEPLTAGWLEVEYWWRRALELVLAPRHHADARIAARLVAEPAGVYLRLVGGAEPTPVGALVAARERLPEGERASLDHALALERSLRRDPDPDLAALLPGLVSLSGHVAAAVAERLAPEGTVAVRLLGTDPWAASVALLDWRALVIPGVDWSAGAPRLAGERLALVPGDPGDPAQLAAGARASRPGRRQALRSGALLVVPVAHPWSEGRLRVLKSAFSDPVSDALLSGRDTALFPAGSPFSARALARRALAEHRAWLACDHGIEGPGPGWLGARPASAALNPAALGLALSAARAALFADSLEHGGGELAVTSAAVADALAARLPELRGVLDETLACLDEPRRTPEPVVLESLQAAVRRLPGYVDERAADMDRVHA